MVGVTAVGHYGLLMGVLMAATVLLIVAVVEAETAAICLITV